MRLRHIGRVSQQELSDACTESFNLFGIALLQFLLVQTILLPLSKRTAMLGTGVSHVLIVHRLSLI